MSDEPTFVDLFALTKITPDSVVERFGSSINSSFFDASNILGGLKIKKLIDFTTLFGNQNAITITDLGRQLLDEANSRVNDQFDHLDLTVLTQLTKGGKSPGELAAAINLKDRDLAMRLFKLQSQGYLSGEFRNGSLSLSLTEKGFMQAKTGMPVQQAQQPQQAALGQQDVQQGQEQQMLPPMPSVQTDGQETEQEQRKSGKGVKIAIAVAVIAVALIVLWQLNLLSMLGI